MIQFNDDCTDLGPTRGCYTGAYQHEGVTLDFCEVGGHNRVLWNTLLNRQECVWSTLYYMIKADQESDDEWIHAYNTLLHTLQHNTPLARCPLVIIVYQHDNIDAHVTDTQLIRKVCRVFQVDLLKRSRPVLVTVLCMWDWTRLAACVTHLLDWTLKHE